jgi:AcrR family transcriptional regulator
MTTRAAGRGKYDRSQSTAERIEQRREALLDAATNVFAAKGYFATRVDDIVAEAGISRRTLYEQFTSVDAILAEVYDRAVRIAFTTIVQKLLVVTDPLERIHVGVRAYYEMIAENPAAAKVVFDVYRHVGPEQAARYELNTNRFASLLVDAINAAVAAGKLGRAPDEVTAYAITKGLEAVGTRALHRGEEARLPEVAPAMARLIIESCRAS